MGMSEQSVHDVIVPMWWV